MLHRFMEQLVEALPGRWPSGKIS